jgi:hypothetical protein
MKTYLFIFAMGFTGVLLLNSAIVYASKSMSHRVAYLAATTLGGLVGMSLGNKL